jgi:hypothetical protein
VTCSSRGIIVHVESDVAEMELDNHFAEGVMSVDHVSDVWREMTGIEPRSNLET